jgi:hypothetical protein
MSGAGSQRQLLPATNQGAVVRWEEGRENQIQLGLTLAEYGRYEVPWNGNITVAEWLRDFNSKEPIEQKEMADDWLSALTNYFDRTVAVICATGQEFTKNEELMSMYGGVDKFCARYPIINTATDYKVKKLNEMTGAFKTVQTWEPDALKNVIIPYSRSVTLSQQGLNDMAYCLSRFTFKSLVPFLNTQLYRRLPAKRRSYDAFVNTSDWNKVRELLKDLSDRFIAFLKSSEGRPDLIGMERRGLDKKAFADSKPSNRQDPKDKRNLARFWNEGLTWYQSQRHRRTNELNTEKIPSKFMTEYQLHFDDEYGLIVPHSRMLGDHPRYEERSLAIEGAIREGSSSPATPVNTAGRPLLLGSTGWSRRSLSASETSTSKHGRSLSERLRIAAGEAGSPEGSTYSENDEGKRRAGNSAAVIQSDAIRALRTRRSTPAGSSFPPPRVREVASEVGRRLRSRRGQLEARDENAEIEDEVDEEVSAPAKHTAKTGRGCRCRTPESVLVKMLQKMTAGRKLADPARVQLITEYYRVCGRPGTADDAVCYNHLQFLAGKMGLKTRSMSAESLREVLIALYNSKDEWGAIQSDVVTSTLFTAPFRGAQQNSDLKSYRYRPARLKVDIDWKRLRKVMGFERDYQEFKKTGTIVLDCFSWVKKDERLMTILDMSYDMYDYHTRLIDGKSNLGWCRTMYHSGMQQLMRGDPLYWLYYAMLREETSLISYPYYTKYTRAKDNTYFRHIDLNISEVVYGGKGKQIIQGSVSWDEEDSQNCTEMLNGFHRHIHSYQQWREKRGIADSTGKIEAWDDREHWPDELRERYPEVRWQKFVCKFGDVRISDPCLPHGSTGPATKVRRTMLPWFVKVHDDMSTMEVPEMGSYAEIAMAHQQLTAAPRTPSGHSNMYGGVKWAFPGDVNPVYSSQISRAVNCQLRWDSPLVIQELKDLFAEPDKDRILKWVRETREKTTEMVKSNWELTKNMETSAYGADNLVGIPDRSFISNRGVHPSRTENWWEYDGQVEQDTALTRLRQEFAMSKEEQVQRLVNNAPLQSPSQSPMSGVTGLTPTSRLSSISREGSPMDQDSPTYRQQVRSRSSTEAGPSRPRAASSALRQELTMEMEGGQGSPNTPTGRFTNMRLGYSPETPTKKGKERRRD